MPPIFRLCVRAAPAPSSAVVMFCCYTAVVYTWRAASGTPGVGCLGAPMTASRPGRSVRGSAARRAVVVRRGARGAVRGESAGRPVTVRVGYVTADWDHRRSVLREDRRGLDVARPSQVSPIFCFCAHPLPVLDLSFAGSQGEYNCMWRCPRPGLNPSGLVNNSSLAASPQFTEVKIL